MKAIGISETLTTLKNNAKAEYIGVIEPKKIDLSKYVINNRHDALVAFRKTITELESHLIKYPDDISAREQLANMKNILDSYGGAC